MSKARFEATGVSPTARMAAIPGGRP
jgi:hypothetical protein